MELVYILYGINSFIFPFFFFINSVPRRVKFIKTKWNVDCQELRERGNGKIICSGHKVSILQDGKSSFNG